MITGECHGMFLLARLHVEGLSQKINRKEVRASLRALPTTLDNTYSDAFQRIRSQAPDVVGLAESIIFWVLCARKTLTVLELQHMYATRELTELPGSIALDDDDLRDGDILTGACGGLIIVDNESQIVRAVHYTAQQYFERHHSHKLMQARLSITNVTLAYLTLPNFSSGVCTTDISMSERLTEHPFLEYATKHWGSEAGELDNELFYPKLQKFAPTPSAVEIASQMWDVRHVHFTNRSQIFPRVVPALVLTAAFDLPQILRRMVSDGHDIEGKGSDHETALIRAASHGHVANVETLLKLKAAVDARDYMDETALRKAARRGQTSVVRVVLDGGADATLKSSSNWTALMSAVSSGNIKIVQLLVKAGVDLTTETVWSDSALSMATRNGQEAIANLLADNGAILPQGPSGRRASVVASRRGLHQLVRRLTANYTAIAKKPLERQTSNIMGGLAEIEEAVEELQPQQEDGNVDFAESIEGLGCAVGLSRKYALLDKIGKGHFAEVFLCTNKVTSVRYAVKVFTVTSWNIIRISNFEGFHAEIQTMRELNKGAHPSILRMADIFAEYTPSCIFVVMELAPEGELFNFIASRQKLTESEARKIFLQLFSAIKFIHDRGWVHRDFKPENILLMDIENLTVKFADFGVAKKLEEGSEPGVWELTTTLCGTPSCVYNSPNVRGELQILSDVAPEISSAAGNRSYGQSVDIWSLGVVFYICLCGFPPFSDELTSTEFPYSLAEQIREARFDYPSPYWDSVGDPALDLIYSTMLLDLEKRFKIQQCIDHPWSMWTVEK